MADTPHCRRTFINSDNRSSKRHQLPPRLPPRSSKLFQSLHRCSTEPTLPILNEFDQIRGLSGGSSYGVLYRPQTCTDVLAVAAASQSYEPRYTKDAKVVVHVTVDGSPGPLKAMVKLNSTVEEAIKLIIDMYREQGRAPKMDHLISDTSFELHHSNYSLKSLNKDELIGAVGGWSFYLRRCNPRTTSDSQSQPSILSHLFIFPQFVTKNIWKMLRAARKLWNILICL